MMTETEPTTTISDRSLSAFLLARGHEVRYSPRPSGHLDFMFSETPELFADILAYNHDATIPVLTFLSAQRLLTDKIRSHRVRQSVWG